jgi:hypothetical protein
MCGLECGAAAPAEVRHGSIRSEAVIRLSAGSRAAKLQPPALATYREYAEGDDD